MFPKFSPVLKQQLSEIGISEPKELQSAFMQLANSGSDLIIEAEEGEGRTTIALAYLIWKLKMVGEDAPRALFFVKDKEEARRCNDLFKALSGELKLRSVAVYENGPLDVQRDDIYGGCDIVIGTPKRILDIYFQNGLNINKLKYFVVDDAETLLKNNYQGALHRLWQSIPKCQSIVFTDVISGRLENLCEEFMRGPQYITAE